MSGRSLRQAVRTPSFGWMYASCVLAGPSQLIPFAHISAAARDTGIADAQAVGLVGRFAIGGLADRFGRAPSLVAMQAALGASFVLWALAQGQYAMFAAFALCVGA